MSELPRGADAALEPVQQALRAAAADQAARIEAEAGHDADATLARAEHDADALLRTARAEGEESAARQTRLRKARARREAADLVLAARSTAQRELDAQITDAVLALKGHRGYSALMKALRRRAESLLGPGAIIEEVPEGGIRAIAGTRRLDASLPALAAEAAELVHDAQPAHGGKLEHGSTRS